MAPDRDGDKPLGMLLIQRDSATRKSLRKAVEGDGHAVLAVPSVAEAMSRLHLRQFDLVVHTDPMGNGDLEEECGWLIDARGLLLRSPMGFDLYLPGIGIGARAVLIVPSSDPQRVSSAIRAGIARLGTRSTAASGAPGAAAS